MKTDRELLELAAKAAGHTLHAIHDYEDGSGCYGVVMSDGYAMDFDPVNDDGDALRLAVKLKIHPQTFTGYTIAQYRPDEDFDWVDLEEWCDDPYAATRRAIVRAAAAIGEALP